MNNSLLQLDTAYGGYLSLTLASGTVSLTLAQASCPIIQLSGTLTSDVIITYPPIGGRRMILPQVDLNGHLLYVRGNNGSDAVGIYFWNGLEDFPYSLLVTPWRVFWDYGGCQPGTVADMATTDCGNGWLPCDGRWVNMQAHDLLFNRIGSTWGESGTYPTGTFKLPDYRGTVTAMGDNIGAVPPAGSLSQNMGNRGILNNWGVAVFGGESTHALSVAELPPDPGHTHSFSGLNAAGGVAGIGQSQPSNAWPFATLSTASANAYPSAAGAAHNNVQPTTTVLKVIKW